MSHHVVKLPTALQVDQWSRGGQEDMLCNIASIEPHPPKKESENLAGWFEKFSMLQAR